MAAVQRKLVHKQFNSPMGLYSQQNVKETLDRELKAFGADGIEVDPEISKPLNLANSAVLRAVEEEEQVKCDASFKRQSRSRQRRQHATASDYLYKQYYEEAIHTPVHQQQLEQIKTQYLCHQHDITIDRDTVLKINRLATRRNLHKRDHSWPPPNNDYTASGDEDERQCEVERGNRGGGMMTRNHGTQSLTQSRSASNEKCSCTKSAVHFGESVCKRHGIDAIREKFNSPTRIIEPTPTELRQQRNKIEQTHLQKQKIEIKQQQKNATNKSARVNDDESSQEMERRTNKWAIGIVGDSLSQQQTLTNVHNNMANTSSVNAASTNTLYHTVAATKQRLPEAMKIGADRDEGDASNIARTRDSSNILDDLNTPKARGFSAPETKAADENIGLVEPRRNYFEQLAARLEHEVPKKWFSYDNISTAVATDGVRAAQQQQQQVTRGNNTTATAINNNRQSQSLDRGRATQQQRRREQLPPLKPRSGSGGGGGSGCATVSEVTSPTGRITPARSLTSEVNVIASNSEGNTTSSGRVTLAGNSSQAHSSMSPPPRIQRRAIKLATEIKICYNDMNADEAVDVVFGYGGHGSNLAAGDTGDLQAKAKQTKVTERTGRESVASEIEKSMPRTFVSSEEAVGEESIKKRHSSDLEHLPLPPTPQEGRVLSAADVAALNQTFEVERMQEAQEQRQRQREQQRKQEQKQQRHLQQQRRHQRSFSEGGAHTTRIIPIEREQQANRAMRESSSQAPPQRDISTVSAEQLYDDACIYLRSIDLDDRTIAYIPAAITIVPSPTEEMLQRWSRGEQTQNLQAGIATRQERSSGMTGGTQATSPAVMQRDTTRASASVPTKQARHKSNEKSSKAPLAADFVVGSDSNENVRQRGYGDKNNFTSNQHEAQLFKKNAENKTQAEGDSCNAHKTAGRQLHAEQQMSNDSQTRNQQTQPQVKSMGKVSANAAAASKTEVAATLGQQSAQRLRAERPRGIYYTDGEYLYGPFTETTGYDECVNGSALKGKTKLTTHVQQEAQQKHAKAQQQQQKEITQQKAQLKSNQAQPRSPSAPPTVARTELEQNAAEIAALEAKYGHFQQSIAEHLRQIDAYMENAKLTLSRSLEQEQEQSSDTNDEEEEGEQQSELQKPSKQAQQEEAQKQKQQQERQKRLTEQSISQNKETQATSAQNVSVAFLLDESPLRALARQLLPQQPLHVASVTADATDENLQAISAPHIQQQPIVRENMPVVERALQALSELKVDSAVATTKGAQAKHVVDKHVNVGLDNNQTKRADGGSILQPLMRRLIAVQPKTNASAAAAAAAAVAAATANVTQIDKPPTDADVDADADAVKLLAIEHHFVPRATLAKRVTILENLNDAIVAAAGRLRRVKPDNIRLIEIEEVDKVNTIRSDGDGVEIAAKTNGKVDDVSNRCNTADDPAVEEGMGSKRKSDSSSSNIEDITKLKEIATIDKLIEVNENGNFVCISKADLGTEAIDQMKQREIALRAHVNDTIKSNVNISKAIVEGKTAEHINDVAANYEQKFMQKPTAITTKTTGGENKMRQGKTFGQTAEEGKEKQQKQKQQSEQQIKLHEREEQQQQQQLKDHQSVSKQTSSETEQCAATFEYATTTIHTPITATRSAPTTPVTSRRRPLSMVEEEPTTGTTTTPNKPAETHETHHMRSVAESEQRQQQHARLQEKLKEATKVPIPPPPPPLPQRIATQQQQQQRTTTTTRAESLPKDLCKNVVSDYISTHQTQEQLVEQVIDVLQIDESQQSVEVEQQQQQQQTQQHQLKQKPQQTHRPQSEQLQTSTTMNQQKPSEAHIADATKDTQNNQLRAGCKTANHEQLKSSLTSDEKLVNQQQSASFAITKINRKLCNQPNTQTNHISVANCKLNTKKQKDTKPARNMVATSTAVEAAAAAAPKTVTEEATKSEIVEERAKRRVFTGQHGALTLQINVSNNNKDKEALYTTDDAFDTYKATYEIPSPIFKQQIIWQHKSDATQKAEQTTRARTQTQIAATLQSTQRYADKSTSSPIRKYPAALIEVPSRAASPFGLNAIDSKTNATAQTTPLRRSHSRSVSPRTQHSSPSLSPIRKYPAALIEPHLPKRSASPFGLNAVDTIRHSHSRSVSPRTTQHRTSSSPIRKYPAALIEPHVPKRSASPFGLNSVAIRTDARTLRRSQSRSVSPHSQCNCKSSSSSPIRKYPAPLIEPHLPTRGASTFGLNDASTLANTYHVTKTLARAHTTMAHSRSVSPQKPTLSLSSIRKYPAALIEPHVHTRAASPFGLNTIDISELIDSTAYAIEVDDDDQQKRAQHLQKQKIGNFDMKVGVNAYDVHNARAHLASYVPQVEGHNVGLLVRASTTPTPQQQRSTESSQIELDKALTHSAVTHYADAEATDDEDDVVDGQHSHARKITSTPLQTTTTRTMSTTPVPLTPSSSSLAFSKHSTLASRHTTPKHGEAHTDTIPTNTPTQTTYLLADRHVRDASTSASIYTAGKSQMRAQSSQTGYSTGNAEFERQQGFDNQQQQQQELLLTDDNNNNNKQLRLCDVNVVVEPADGLHHQPRESGVINRSFDNVSPRPYISIEGYKRVAWPPLSEERVVREFTPQPTATHYPVSGGQQQQQQQPAQQHQPQHLQQQPQQHQPTHYQQQQQQQQPSAAPANQGPIYNNVSRAAHQYQQQVQKYYEPPQHNPQTQQSQQPIQYTQAQFNRQHSHEPAGTAYGQHVNGNYEQPHEHQQQKHQPQNYPYEHEPQQQYGSNGPSGWKSIQAPVPTAHNEYQVGPAGGNYSSYGQQQQQQQPAQQYRATSYDQYQQQAQQQYPPHQGSQPAYSAQSYQQPPYHQAQQQPPQQQQPSWAHNQQALPYQPAQAPYQEAPPQQQQQQYQPPLSSNYQAQPPYQSQYQAQPQTQYSSVPLSNQYNSYSQPQQQQHVGQDQPDQRASAVQPHPAQSLPQDYRGGSPGIITLRKEAPMTQKPSPVYNAQPAAISLQGGSHLRGDLKWPPPEYKEAAARENEERRQLALGPVCRPRLVKRDYTQFFAKNAINCYYPSYKVPPGTQHMLS